MDMDTVILIQKIKIHSVRGLLIHYLKISLYHFL